MSGLMYSLSLSLMVATGWLPGVANMRKRKHFGSAFGHLVITQSAGPKNAPMSFNRHLYHLTRERFELLADVDISYTVIY